MSQLAAPALSAAVDAEHASGQRATLTLTPGVSGTVTRVAYRIRGAGAWTLGALVAGTAGLETTTTVTGLVQGEVYEFILWTDDGTDHSPPSLTRRACPTDGTGSLEERILRAIKAELLGITIADGYYATVQAVYRNRMPNVDSAQALLSDPAVFIMDVGDQTTEEMGLGLIPLSSQRKLVKVQAWSEVDTRQEDGSGMRATQLRDAIVKAVMEDPKHGGLAIDTSPINAVFSIMTEETGRAGVEVEFAVEYWHRSDNPSTRV